MECMNHPRKMQQYIVQLPEVKQIAQLTIFEQEPALTPARSSAPNMTR
jgi:hypothetical protein